MKQSIPRPGESHPRPDGKSFSSFSHARTPPTGQPGSSYLKMTPVETPAQANVDPLGTASLLAGICGIALFWLPWVNLLFPVMSITLGTVSLRRTGRGAYTAVAGVVLGSVLFLIGVFVIDVAASLSGVLHHPAAPVQGGTP